MEKGKRGTRLTLNTETRLERIQEGHHFTLNGKARVERGMGVGLN